MATAALEKTLLHILSDQRFHSGSELAAALQVSRTAVWKAIRGLESLGLPVSAVPGKGYRVAGPLELLNAAAIEAGLTPEARALLTGLELHDRIDSTNSQLLRAAAAGADAGRACLAETQTAGRGRVGRRWLSPLGANIYLSLLWRYDEPSQAAGLSLALGVAVLRALAEVGVTGVGLKWPNDFLWNERKLGGLLVEVVGESHGSCAVVAGLGLNRHLPREWGRNLDQAWTDLTEIAGSALPSRNRLAAALLNQLLPVLAGYPASGLSAYLTEWRAHHHLQGREAVIRQGDAWIRGRILDVTAAGFLLLECADGARREFASGDLRLRLAGS
ncbi:biotin--[acetyl-CoA-carboxylase] ligase [Candidatus Methylocalor cossyra]|uniref:Bifunctional ligase/repressor BirA n=1 Tax=Candidatus Methylocalor cossyra TaxID=3108543 RepID=A0ABM9NKU5_9GAMM